jgi:hypothetical protein
MESAVISALGLNPTYQNKTLPASNHFAALAHMVGWVKRNVGTIYVGFAYLNAPQKFVIATKLANPTRLVADRRLNPTYDLLFRPTKWIPPFK